MENTGKLVYTTLLGIAVLAGTAPAIILMWGWFVTPTFGLAVPAFGLMMGLLILVSTIAFTTRKVVADEEDLDMGLVTTKAFLKLLGIWILVFMAFLVKIIFI